MNEQQRTPTRIGLRQMPPNSQARHTNEGLARAFRELGASTKQFNAAMARQWPDVGAHEAADTKPDFPLAIEQGGRWKPEPRRPASDPLSIVWIAIGALGVMLLAAALVVAVLR